MPNVICVASQANFIHRCIKSVHEAKIHLAGRRQRTTTRGMMVVKERRTQRANGIMKSADLWSQVENYTLSSSAMISLTEEDVCSFAGPRSI